MADFEIHTEEDLRKYFTTSDFDTLVFGDFIDRLNDAKEIIISNGGRKYKELSKSFSSAKDALKNPEYSNEEKRNVACQHIISAINIVNEKKIPYADIWKGLQELETLEYDLERRYREAR